MAQVGFTPIRPYHSVTAGVVPLAANLLVGELALNVADKRAFTKDGTGVVELGTNPSTIAITAGSIDGTPIGATTPSSGAFTSVSGNGSGLTNLNAGALFTGTVATARLGSGTASATTYLRGDSTWQALPSGNPTITDDVATSAVMYPTWVSAASGSQALKVSSTGLAFNPSQSTLAVGGPISAWGAGVKAIQINGVGNLYSLPTYMAMSHNVYTDGSNSRYQTNGSTGIFGLTGNVLTFYTAASGTTGNVVANTPTLTINALNQLFLGTTTSSLATTNRGHIAVSGSTDSILDLQVAGSTYAYFVTTSTGSTLGTRAATPMLFITNAVERMRLAPSAPHVGIGTTPLASWDATHKVLQIGDSALAFNSGGTGSGFMRVNVFYDGAVDRYMVTGPGLIYGLTATGHQWYTAPSGTAGTPVTTTEYMRLSTAGYLYVNGPQGLGILGTFRVQVQGSVMTYGDGQGYRALNGTANGAINLTALAGAGAGGKIDSEGGPISLWTNGAERVRIDNTGNVGIGTTTPAINNYKSLVVDGSVASVFTQRVGGTTIAAWYTDAGLSTIGTSTAVPLYFSTNSVERLRITAGGNVGIGTTAPTDYGATTRCLSIAGTTGTGFLDIYNNNVRMGFLASSTWMGLTATASASGLLFNTNGSDKVAINNNGDLLVGTTASHILGGATRQILLQPQDVNANDADIQVRGAGAWVTSNSTNASGGGYGGFRYFQNDVLKFGVVALGAGDASMLFTNGVANNERMRITGAGRIGIGTAAPSTLLQVGDISDGQTDKIRVAGTYNFEGPYLGAYNNNGGSALELTTHGGTDNSSSFRISYAGDVNGNLNIDYANAVTTYAALAYTTVYALSQSGSIVGVSRSATSSIADQPFYIARNKSAPLNGIAGGILADTYRDVADPHYTAGMWFIKRNLGSVTSETDIVFGAQGSNSASITPIERMRINSNGTVGIGVQTTANATGGFAQLYVRASSGAADSALVLTNFGDGLGTGIQTVLNPASVAGLGWHLACFGTTGAQNGGIYQNLANQISFQAGPSDYRLKDLIDEPLDSGAFIDALKPRQGKWKLGGHRFVGFLAHEFQQVLPASVIGRKDERDDFGKPVYQSMSYTDPELITMMVAEIKALRARLKVVETFEERLALLERSTNRVIR